MRENACIGMQEVRGSLRAQGAGGGLVRDPRKVIGLSYEANRHFVG